MRVYERDPDAAPDSDFEPGELKHLVPGNRGRLLDARRTPITIVALRFETGSFILRIDGFEDEGAQWEIPFEKVDRYQFALDARTASVESMDRMRGAIARFDQPLHIACCDAARAETEHRIIQAQQSADQWLTSESRFFGSGRALPDPPLRVGEGDLWHDVTSYFGSIGLRAIEQSFAEQYVRNPHAAEIVKGHAIVIAELGLAPFVGTRVRDPQTFEGEWSRERRGAHVIARLGLLRALFKRLGRDHLMVYRGMSSEQPFESRAQSTFVSGTLDRTVADSHFDAYGPHSFGILAREPVAIERVFMTYLETEAMNQHYREAEVVMFGGADLVRHSA